MNTVFLVRHGENLANITHEFSSRRIDYSLTEKGVLQAQQTADRLRHAAIDEIYSSPLKRARETAAIIAAACGLDFTVMDNFREVDVGDYELEPIRDELWEIHNRIFIGWITGQPHAKFPNGDDYFSLLERMRTGIQQVTAGKNGRRILVVGHGGIFTATLKDLIPGLDYRDLFKIPMSNCSITELEMEESLNGPRGRLVSWASSAHLSGEAAELVLGFPKKGSFQDDSSS